MERLTCKYDGENVLRECCTFDRASQTEPDDYIKCDSICQMNENCDTCPINKAINKLAEYEDMEEQGLLLKLPCKIGDTVYILAGRFGTFYEEDVCESFCIGRNGMLEIKVQNNKGNHSAYGVVGKQVFLTKEDAEKALKQMWSDSL